MLTDHHRLGTTPGEMFGPTTTLQVTNALQQECSAGDGHVLSKLDMGYLDKLQLTDRVPC
jgi:hypothetical protein